MMRDFARFLACLYDIVYFIRGVVLAFALMLLLCVVVIVMAERMPIGQAVYFTFVTTLTIGYGDVVPTTAWGRIASVAAGIFGLLANGIVVAATVRALTLAVQEKLEAGAGDKRTTRS